MQRWDYLLVVAPSGKVTEVNGQKVGQVRFSGIEGEPLHEYLSHMGQEGWEAVGFTTTDSGQYSVLLKRPMTE